MNTSPSIRCTTSYFAWDVGVGWVLELREFANRETLSNMPRVSSTGALL